MCAFHKTINYSSCNEDWRSEERALKIEPEDIVLCITGSGDRPMHALLSLPARVVALDANPVQNYLLELKIAALEKFPYDRYTGFLGLQRTENRKKDALLLMNSQSVESAKFWSSHKKTLEKGVLYSGRFERFYRKVSLASRFLRFSSIRKLFLFANIEEQKNFIQTKWDTWWWRLVYIVLCSKPFLRIFLRDPAFYRFVNLKETAGIYIYNAMREILMKYPARENFMLSLVFRGRLSEDDLPPYLKKEDSALIKENLSRLEIRSEDILSFLKAARENTFTKFSLSDVPSYLTESEFQELLEGVVRSAKNGARICLRFFLVYYEIPESLQANFVREVDLENTLAKTDRTFAYRFLVATVYKQAR